jgi:glycine/D-amino acid oxidase-like deaminating enzyme
MSAPITSSSRVIVVGSGILGGAISLALLQKGVSVCQIRPLAGRKDSASLAAGAMLGAFAEVTAEKNSRMDHEETAFRVRASSLYPSWLEEVSFASSVSVDLGMGTFIVANTFGRNDLRNLQAIEAELARFGAPYESVDERDVPGYHPNERYLPRRIIWLPQEGFVDTEALTAALDVATDSHVRFSHEDCQVDRLVLRGGRVCGVALTDGRELEGDHVVLAAGVGTQLLLETLPVEARLPCPRLMPGKGTSLILETTERFPHVMRSPNRDFACGIHIVPRGQGRIYVGATNRTASCPGTSPGASVEEVHDLLHEVVHEFNTGLDAANIESIRVGSRPICVDGYPLVGSTECPGLSLATGTYRNGVLMAPLIARILASEIVGDSIDEANPFSPRGRRIQGDALSSSTLFKSGAEGIVSFLPSPHGSLPYKRTEELSGFLHTLLAMALKDGDELESLRQEARRLLQSQPMNESFAQLFFMLGERQPGGERQES